jgi:hypothetical protein
MISKNFDFLKEEVQRLQEEIVIEKNLRLMKMKDMNHTIKKSEE